VFSLFQLQSCSHSPVWSKRTSAKSWLTNWSLIGPISIMLFWLCFKLPCSVYFIVNYIRPHTFGKVFSVFSTFKELQIHPRSSILRVLLLKHTFSIDHSYLLAGNSYIAQLSNYLRMWTFCLFCHLQQSNLSGIMFTSIFWQYYGEGRALTHDEQEHMTATLVLTLPWKNIPKFSLFRITHVLASSFNFQVWVKNFF